MKTQSNVVSTQSERHLSIRELAEREGVPETTVYRWNVKGTGPRYLRIGKYVRFKLSDVLAWENAQYDPESGRHAKKGPGAA